MARPSKLSESVQGRIVQAIRAGNYGEQACRAAGISPSTYYRWLERGAEQTNGSYRDFHDAVRQAEAEAEVHAVAIVRRAMADDWRAAITYLERRYPARWRRQQTTELVGGDGGPIRTETSKAIDLKELNDEELRFLASLYERAAKPD